MLVFVGSNSSKSINKQLTKAVLKELDITHTFVDLKALDIPLFSEDLEREIKSPEGIVYLKEQIDSFEHIFITTNEHNQNLSAFLKNILDWLSRMELKFLENKKIFILSTSNGKRGALGANESLQKLVERFGCTVFESYAFSSFSENFDTENQQITNKDFLTTIQNKLNIILKS
ncbi:NAD(P)H-dependent FMN reductase [Paenimyroides aquimaris]|uniref:NAD(P)H-dependent FMN reductase n=1 Tax=Paenimyroides marinum TaxID=1159016 RepID=A0A1H6KP71_9FLAO|nr:NADPH-dependent FMN reductase [Paenimyroides aquimaris]SEH73644.1 NAD(P)H-dependent FMN reductase [Paenimyroides aquimaris]